MIQMRMKDLFFDSAAVTGAVSKERRRALSKAGAFIRRTARQSMRKGAGPSKPGRPPNRHANPLLYSRLFFAYDSSTRSVIVGSEALNGGSAPNTLEFGGDVVVPRRSRGGSVVEARPAKVPPRPYMGPALAKELPKLAEPWANSLRGGPG
ncbi:MAG: hypothetical protein IBJ10_02245 [Phycisphaerales bacterium]|nr:hypothetical protein [Phycisphaerales bacterium]